MRIKLKISVRILLMRKPSYLMLVYFHPAERQSNRNGELPLLHSPNVHNRQAWVWPKPRSQTSVKASHWGAETQAPGTASTNAQDALAGN